MAWTADLVEERFDDAQAYAEESITKANEYMDALQLLLDGLVQPSTDEIDDIVVSPIDPIDYAAIPNFTDVIGEFPTFASMLVLDPELDEVPDITGTVPSRNFNFISNIPSKPTLNYGTAPTAPSLSSISLPDAPSLTLPTAPTLTDVTVPAPPVIDLPDFTATAPSLEALAEPTTFSFTEDAYNSDLRVALFDKILNDILNGGTGLDATVEQDIWDRFLARQVAENDRLYQEVQNQFAATGFGLPTGAYASRLLQVSSDISLKNDQANRDITIAQAELAQKNTLFSVEQAGILERMLVDFFNAQQTRSLQAKQALAANAVEIYNSLVNRQNLLLEQYKTEAEVFESKVRAELAAIEIFRAEVEGVKASVDVQQSRVNLYNAQVASVDIFLKIYQTEMESAKLQAEVQNLQLGLFRTQTEAYVAQINAERAKADVYKVEVDAESTRADAFRSEVTAYEAEVRGKLGVIESERIKATNVIAMNQLKIDEYRAKIDKYRSEIEAEIRTANLAVSAYQANTSAFQAQTGAKEMEFRSRVAESAANIEVVKAKLQKAMSLVESATESYVKLKELAINGTEGIMNVNAQLAASAMNAVNASASQSISSSSSESESTNYNYSGTV